MEELYVVLTHCPMVWLLTCLDDDARAPTRKLLAKWRPHVLEADTANAIKPEVKQIPTNNAQRPPDEQSAPAKPEMAPTAVAAAS